MSIGMVFRLVVCLAVAACAGSAGTWAMPTAHMRPMIVSRNFDWFPDGQRIAFESNLERPAPVAHAQRLAPDDRGLDVFVVRRDGTGLVNLTRDNPDRADVYPSVSPDGERIAFLRRSDRSWDLVVIGVDGSAPRVLASGVVLLARPTWSPDGREIAFSACCERELSRVYAIGSDGEGRHALAEGSAQVAWSPDGSRIAYVGPVVGNPALVVADRGGGSPRLLTRDVEGGHAVAWSPDSTRIAFDVPAPLRRLDVGVAVVSADGGPTSLISRPGSRPTWSPDGSRLAFDSWLPYGDGDIETFDVRTGIVTPLVHGPRIQHSPRWSPGGAHLAYVSEAGEADRPDVGSYLEVVRANGSDPVRITPESPPAMPKVVPAETIAHPDGLYVADVTVQPTAVRVGGRVRASVTVETQEWGDFVEGAIVFVAHCSRETVIRAAPAVTRAGRATIAIRVVSVSLARNAVCLRFRARVPGDTEGRIYSYARDPYVRVKRGR